MEIQAKRLFGVMIVCCATATAASERVDSSPTPQAAEARPTATDIEHWIVDLDSDRFALRQAATLHLERSGEPAVAPLAAAADGRQPEVTRRAIDVLAALSDSDEAGAAGAAREALENLARSEHRLAANRAAVVLREQHLRQQRAAILELRNLGADLQIGGVDEGELVIGRMVLGRAWQGGEEALKLLPRVRRIDELKLFGPQFSDASLDAIVELSGVQMFRLYGTLITDAGQQRLAAAFPGALIDRRYGAKLGVKSLAFGNGNGCRIDAVVAGSAAAAAGMKPDDVIVRLDDQPIADMNALIAGIAGHKPGARVRVTFRRGDEEHTREVVLGELGEQEE